MRVLVTAGSTQAPIDKVRCISNIFKGKTGGNIAKYLANFGANVTLLTSADEQYPASIRVERYKTFDDLHALMEKEIHGGSYHAIIHSAAVSDYQVSQVLVQVDGKLSPVDSSKKISSSHGKLYLELSPTIKLVDKIREPWGFKGKLIKFKLQVGIEDDVLLDIATKSMAASDADYIVANCLEWSQERAYIIDAKDNSVVSVTRDQLAAALYQRLVTSGLV